MNDETYERLVEPYEILEEKDVRYSCNCSSDKFYRGLITLGKEQLKDIFSKEKELEAECHFCGKKYKFKTFYNIVRISFKFCIVHFIYSIYWLFRKFSKN